MHAGYTCVETYGHEYTYVYRYSRCVRCQWLRSCRTALATANAYENEVNVAKKLKREAEKPISCPPRSLSL